MVEELAGRDPVGCRQVGQVAVDAGVEVDAALVGQLQHDDGDERLGGAADVPRHVRIDGPAGRVERRRAATRLGDRAVGVAHGDAGTDELTRRLVVGQDARQLRLARRIDRDGRRGCGRLRCRGRRWRLDCVGGGAAAVGGAGSGLVGGADVGFVSGGALASATVSAAARLPSSSDEHAAMPSRAPTTASDAAVAAIRRRRGV